MYRIIFLADAIVEIENAGKWYAEQQVGLDKRFTDTTLAAIENCNLTKLFTDQFTED